MFQMILPTKRTWCFLAFLLSVTLLCSGENRENWSEWDSSGIYSYPSPHKGFPASPFYSVRVAKNGEMQQTFVYLSEARTEGPGTQFVTGRTLSYTGFMATGVVTVEVELFLNGGLAPGGVKIRPSRFAIVPEMLDERTVRFELSREGQFTVEFGEQGYLHALVIAYDPWESGRPDFNSPAVLRVEAGSRGNPVEKIKKHHTIYFEQGVHDLGGRIELPRQVKNVYLEPGAYVLGAIYITHSDVVIQGRGVLSSENLAHRQAHSIETPPEARRVLIEGIVVANYAQFAVRTLGRDNIVRWVKCVGGWIYNADGLVGWAGTTLRNNFIHADDDAIKLYDDNVLVEDCVIWQMTNGACLQLGWSSLSARRIRVRNIDVIRTEWRSNGGANNSVINLRIAADRGPGNTQQDFLFENIFVETPVDRFLDLRFKGKKKHRGNRTDGGRHRLQDFHFKNIHVSMPSPANPHSGNFFLPYDEHYGYKNILFENLFVNGTPVTEENYLEAGFFSIPAEVKREIRFKSNH